MRDFSAKARLVLVQVKIARAKKHLEDFEREAEAFRNAYTNVIGTQTDRKTRDALRYFIKLPISKFEVVAIAGDVLQNLRSALDHLAYQLVEAGQCRPLGEKAGSRIAFPIIEKSSEYQNFRRRKMKGARQSAIKAIDALKPYKGGNSVLWDLHYANNVDKHRHLIRVAPDYLFEGNGFNGHFWQKAARPLFKGIFGTEVDENVQFATKKTLKKSKISDRQPLLEFLREQVKFVEDLVETFECHLKPRRRRTHFP